MKTIKSARAYFCLIPVVGLHGSGFYLNPDRIVEMCVDPEDDDKIVIDYEKAGGEHGIARCSKRSMSRFVSTQDWLAD